MTAGNPARERTTEHAAAEPDAVGTGAGPASTLADQLGVDGPLPTRAVAAAAIHPRYHLQLVMARDEPTALHALLSRPPRVSAAAAASLGLTATPPADEAAAPHGPEVESASPSARRAATAAVRWAASGFALADEATRERRRAACATCPHWMDPPDRGAHRVTRKLHPRGKVCGLCGCVTDLKIRLASEACPDVHPDDPTLTRWGEPRPRDGDHTTQENQISTSRPSTAEGERR